MKRSFTFLVLILATAVPAAAQNQTRERRVNGDSSAASMEKTARTRVVADQRDANHVRQPDANAVPANTSKTSAPAWGDTAVPVKEAAKQTPLVVNPNRPALPTAQPKLLKLTTQTINDARSALNSVALTSSNSVANPASIYRVGVGDVLDIRLSNMATRESTLFTVLKSGAIEYPLLEKPLPVAGLTTDEIARRVNTEVRVIQNARASVAVRDYASHSIVINGAVDNPGQKILRREAMPLFAILAEALPRAEAANAMISRNGKEISISLANNEQMATLVMPGDAIKIAATTKQFIYVGGDVATAGEKELRANMTLTQALLAAGGAPRDARGARIARRSAAGLLATQEYDLAAISEGRSADPLLQPGDRIEVKRGVW